MVKFQLLISVLPNERLDLAVRHSFRPYIMIGDKERFYAKSLETAPLQGTVNTIENSFSKQSPLHAKEIHEPCSTSSIQI